MCSYEVSIIPLPNLPSASTKPAPLSPVQLTIGRWALLLLLRANSSTRCLSPLVSTTLIRWLSKNYDLDNQGTVAAEFHSEGCSWPYSAL